MSIEYSPNDRMSAAVTDLLGDETYTEFAEIREQELLFMVAAMVKFEKEEQKATSGPPVVVRRVSAADAVFIQGHFKVYICQTRWDEANDLQQKAMLHRALMRVSVEKTDDGIKIGTRKPDVETFQQTIIRFGAWDEGLIQLRNNLQSAKKRAAEEIASKA